MRLSFLVAKPAAQPQAPAPTAPPQAPAAQPQAPVAAPSPAQPAPAPAESEPAPVRRTRAARSAAALSMKAVMEGTQEAFVN